MNQSLVVYYSLEGNTRLIAESIADSISGDLLSVKPKKDLKAVGFFKYVWGGKQAFFKEKPELEPLANDTQDYDILFIGTPVWNSSMTPAIRSFLSQTDLAGKQVALFCCYSGKPSKTFLDMHVLLEHSDIIGEMGFKAPLEENEAQAVESARHWAKDIIREFSAYEK